ncbi:type 1 fimbrial protein [Serratia rubidaea]|uniref:fimbrial protein n=1 Tax=Serratia rubidaea TaxID=61652 RepID=UPI001F2D52E9|nr:fimbrial protein [Serratia rubidaea]UJD79349.1 type 1 fimbrial protein [Serratia rubidaea]UJD83903.1 type 1 fimbrial protein [Serratia rubidaea]
MMNKTLIAMAILGSAAFISAAQAADGTINFTGNITDAACTVTPASASQTVALGTVNSGAFAAAGDTASPTKFGITLTSCPATVTTASVKFDGPTDAANSNLLALTSATGVATGVGVGIYEENATTLIPVSSTSVSKTLSTTTDTTFNFIAKYVATAAAVTAGPANAVSDFTISYN